jgi:hypothetical protein
VGQVIPTVHQKHVPPARWVALTDTLKRGRGRSIEKLPCCQLLRLLLAGLPVFLANFAVLSLVMLPTAVAFARPKTSRWFLLSSGLLLLIGGALNWWGFAYLFVEWLRNGLAADLYWGVPRHDAPGDFRKRQPPPQTPKMKFLCSTTILKHFDSLQGAARVVEGRRVSSRENICALWFFCALLRGDARSRQLRNLLREDPLIEGVLCVCVSQPHTTSRPGFSQLVRKSIFDPIQAVGTQRLWTSIRQESKR